VEWIDSHRPPKTTSPVVSAIQTQVEDTFFSIAVSVIDPPVLGDQGSTKIWSKRYRWHHSFSSHRKGKRDHGISRMSATWVPKVDSSWWVKYNFKKLLNKMGFGWVIYAIPLTNWRVGLCLSHKNSTFQKSHAFLWIAQWIPGYSKITRSKGARMERI
jgi:hypothetical protein